MSDTDLELLARYTRHHAEDAFSEVVQRHLDLVYSAALRQVRSPQLAEEVAQSTFIKLARQAPQLAPDTILTAWLYQVARRESIDVVRREARRQLREQIAVEMNAMNATAADWTHIEPLLDDAMHALDDTDRTAVLLRYFEGQPAREMAQTLGISDEAAQKRVSRAVERLREFFAKRGVTTGASGLVVLISANAVLTAPAGLSAVITAGAIATAATVAITHATVTTMSLMNAKSIAAILSAALLVGTTIYFIEEQRLGRSAARERVLLEQQAQLVAARDTVVSTVSQADDRKEENGRQDARERELARLRNEITLLRQQLITTQQTSGGGTNPAPIGTPPLAPGQLVSKAQLAFADYATPEAGLQSMIWATVSRDFRMWSNSLAYEIRPKEIRDGVDRSDRVEFEGAAVLASESFQGLQILARKVEGQDHVLILAMTDGFVVNAKPGPSTNSFLMVRSGNSWKFARTDGFDPNSWSSGNNIQKYVP